MRKQLAMRWVKALRSGDYHQGEGSLRMRRYEFDADKETYVYTREQYCCLGVLYSVVKCKKPPKQGFLTKMMLKEVGLTHKMQEKLAAMNDGTTPSNKKSFRTIANWIEKNYQKLGVTDDRPKRSRKCS